MANIVDASLLTAQPTNIKIGGETIKLFNDAEFKKVRTFRNVADDAITSVDKAFTGKDEFDFQTLRESGGKGGDLMGFTKIYSEDRENSKVGNYIIKEMKGDDHKSLTSYVNEYCHHVTDKHSYITCFYFHFQTTKDMIIKNKKLKKPRSMKAGTNFVVMANCMPGVDKVKDMFDLKGSADDKTQLQNGVKVDEVHKRCWSPMNCGIGITQERQDYARGKKKAFTCDFIVTKENRKIILDVIKYDTDFLAACNLMDYSLLVGIKRGSPEDFIPGITPDQPYLGTPKKTGKPEAYYIGIIDFLQGWNWKKDVASCLKTFAPKPLSTVKPAIYGPRFYDFFDNKFKASDDKNNKYYCEPIRKKLLQVNAPKLADDTVTILLNESLLHEEDTATIIYGGQTVELKKDAETRTDESYYKYTFPLPDSVDGNEVIVNDIVVNVSKHSSIENVGDGGEKASDIVLDINDGGKREETI
jgi:hypothetical protein